MSARQPTGTERLWDRIFRVVAMIPAGKVATYGQIAEAAGLPRQARLVGYALNSLDHDTELPWHRVINAQGRSSLDDLSGAAAVQRALLEQEGVVFSATGRVDLSRFRADFSPSSDEPAP